MKKYINWYWLLIAAFFVGAGAVFLILGEDSYIAIHDNLDLFIPQYQMMKDTGTFWSHGVDVPFLGGISRDTLPAEFSLYTMMYMILPAYWAYVAGYFLKILIAMVSCYLLAGDLFSEKLEVYKPIIMLMGFAYGVLNMFPNFGIPFASIPLVIFIVRRIYAAGRITAAAKWYAALFFYPLLSYFSYFGLFILAYLVVAVIWLSLRDKKLCGRLVLSVAVLAAGYIACEYRLFGEMLFSNTETIRSTIVAGSFTAGEIVREIWSVWKGGMFHAESMHTWLVLPVCVVYFCYLNISYLKSGNGKAIFHDQYNLLFLVLIFNSLIYGLYYWEGFRNIVEAVCPPLKGWQFNRTVFFSPFVWYAAFFLVLKRLYDTGRRWWIRYANVLAVVSILMILSANSRYNDLYHTCYYKAAEILKGRAADRLSYQEFYSVELFQKAKAEIGYQGEWSAAYGFYPAVLEYNQIATLDGYLGFYSQEYKEAFRKVIAPALERVPESRSYFDEWGARVNLYSGNHLSATSGARIPAVREDELFIDTAAFKALGGCYIFSRIPLTNSREVGFSLRAAIVEEGYPVAVYIYEAE